MPAVELLRWKAKSFPMDQNQQQADERTPEQHILLHEGKWAVMPEGAVHPIQVFESRDEALRWAGRSANHQGVTLVVHNEDGSINDTIRPES